MTQLVTLEQAKAQLNLDHALDDNTVALMIEGASAAVLAYLGDVQYLFVDTGGELIEFDTTDTGTQPEQEALRALHLAGQATLVLVADWYKNREGQNGQLVEAQWGYGYLPRPVVALLYPLRIPTIA